MYIYFFFSPFEGEKHGEGRKEGGRGCEMSSSSSSSSSSNSSSSSSRGGSERGNCEGANICQDQVGDGTQGNTLTRRSKCIANETYNHCHYHHYYYCFQDTYENTMPKEVDLQIRQCGKWGVKNEEVNCDTLWWKKYRPASQCMKVGHWTGRCMSEWIYEGEHRWELRC